MSMKRWLAVMGILGFSGGAWALDPMAPREERGFGRVTVHTPQPDNSITVTHLRSGASYPLQADQTLFVPVGRYEVQVQMQNYSYRQSFDVVSAETSFITVPGYGNLKVNAPRPDDRITVTNRQDGSVVAAFPASETKTLPRGHYDVKVEVAGGLPAVEENVWVVTNTTRVLDVHPNGKGR